MSHTNHYCECSIDQFMNAFPPTKEIQNESWSISNEKQYIIRWTEEKQHYCVLITIRHPNEEFPVIDLDGWWEDNSLNGQRKAEDMLENAGIKMTYWD